MWWRALQVWNFMLALGEMSRHCQLLLLLLLLLLLHAEH